jgi:hypothetical protein
VAQSMQASIDGLASPLAAARTYGSPGAGGARERARSESLPHTTPRRLPAAKIQGIGLRVGLLAESRAGWHRVAGC